MGGHWGGATFFIGGGPLAPVEPPLVTEHQLAVTAVQKKVHLVV